MLQKNRLFVYCLFLFLAIGTLLARESLVVDAEKLPSESSPTWITQCLDCPYRFSALSKYASEFDSNDQLHIAYGGDKLVYTIYDGSSWSTEVVDASPQVGRLAQLALDGDDNPHIFYYDVGADGVKYAYKQGSQWLIETVSTGQIVEDWFAFTVDNAGNPHVVFHRYIDETVIYGIRTNGSWSFSEFTGYEFVTGLGIVTDDANRPHLIIGNDSATAQLEHVYFDGASWQTVTIDTGLTFAATVTISGDGVIHVVYHPFSQIMYATWDGSSWQTEVVNDDADYEGPLSLSTDSDNNPHISYYVETTNTLYYAQKTTGTWQVDMVNSPVINGDSSISLNSNDEVLISYLLASNYLAYSVEEAGAWVWDWADFGRTVGHYPSMVMDSDNDLHVSYSSSNGHLLYTYQEDSLWSMEEIEVGLGAFDVANSIVLDTDDEPHVAYIDDLDGVLRYAQKTPAGWEYTTVATRGNLTSPSLQLDDMGYPHISFGSTNGLEYGYFDGATWNFETVDMDTGTSFSVSYLYLQADGQPQIGYKDNGFNLATRTDSGWTIENIPSDTGDFAFAWNGDGTPHFVVATINTRELLYHYKDGATWQSETISPIRIDLFKQSVSLTFDSNDNPHIAYVDLSPKDVIYVTKSDGVWESTIVTTIEPPSNSQGYVAIELSPADQPYIAYGHTGLGDLMLSSLGYEIFLPIIQQ